MDLRLHRRTLQFCFWAAERKADNRKMHSCVEKSRVCVSVLVSTDSFETTGSSIIAIYPVFLPAYFRIAFQSAVIFLAFIAIRFLFLTSGLDLQGFLALFCPVLRDSDRHQTPMKGNADERSIQTP